MCAPLEKQSSPNNAIDLFREEQCTEFIAKWESWPRTGG